MRANANSNPSTSRSQIKTQLRITEIFLSLQGESSTVGYPTVFVRLTGCPLRCGYCDTAYAFQGGDWKSLDEIVAEVVKHQVPYVTVTGGEPLAQKACLVLLKRLVDKGFKVSLETSGALDISAVDAGVVNVMDIKTPGSGEEAKNYWPNIEYLKSGDQIKFVLCDRADYDWAKQIMGKYQLFERCDILLSPSYEQLAAQELAQWILEDKLQVRFQIQLHKFLWGNAVGK